MKSEISTITSTVKALPVFTCGQIQGNSKILSDYITVGTTSSLVYEILFTGTYTVSNQGIISVICIFIVDITTNNDVNAESKFQLSRDGGGTFIDITGDIGSGELLTGGVGRWISGVDTGNDKFKFRILGRSTDGNPATVRVDIFETFGVFVINKAFN